MPETKLEPRTPRAADTAQPQPKSHGLALKDRRHLAVTGVIRVISCDENAAVLETPLGNLTVGGQEPADRRAFHPERPGAAFR